MFVELSISVNWLLDFRLLFLLFLLGLFAVSNNVLVLVMNSEQVLELPASADFKIAKHGLEVIRDFKNF